MTVSELEDNDGFQQYYRNVPLRQFLGQLACALSSVNRSGIMRTTEGIDLRILAEIAYNWSIALRYHPVIEAEKTLSRVSSEL